MSTAPKSRSKTPKKGAAPVAAVPESAAAGLADAAATPPGSGVPGGATNTVSESGAAAGPASADPVKPHDKDGTSTPGMVPEATNSQSAPEAEAAASGGQRANSEPSQGDRDGGAGDLAGSADILPVSFGVDLSTDRDVTVLSLGRIVAWETDFPRTFDLLGRALESGTPVTAIRVTARTDGFWRAGIRHSARGQEFSPDTLSAEVVETCLADAELIVEIV